MDRRLFLAMLALTACGTHADSVCQDIGYCRSESDDQITACQSEAKDLIVEARGSGCSAQVDAYFACADERYECKGNVPTFSGCEEARAELDTCLAQGRAQNACGELEVRLAACPAAAGTPIPAPCGAAEVCTSRCYLDSVANPCAPQPLELTHNAQCGQQCPL